MLSPGFSSELRTRFRALRYRNFRLYWIGQLVSLIGTWMQSVAQGWLMHRLTNSPFMLGLLSFFQFLPVLIFSLWAGVIADHMDKRRLLVFTQFAFLLQAALLATLVSTHVIQPWMLLALAGVFGIFNAFDLPLRQSFLVEMVGKEDLSNGIALNSAAFNAARVLGPAAAGVLLATIGEAGCFWINAASYVAVIVSLMRMDLPRNVAARGYAAFSTLTEGVRYAMSTRPIRNLLLLLAVTTSLGFQYMVLLPVYARDILHGGPQAFGLMVAAFGVGSLFSAVRMTRHTDRSGLRRNLLIGLTVSGVGMAGFAWSRWLALSLATGFLAGYGLILYVASVNTMVQLTTEDRYRGRIMSLYTFFFIGTAPLGALISGTIAQRAGAPVATSFSALVLLLGALWVAYRIRVLAAREAPRPVEPVLPEKVG
jgi:MFS family permease